MRKKDYIKFCLLLFILSLGGCPCSLKLPSGGIRIPPEPPSIPMDENPSWSSDGNTIAFYRFDPAEKPGKHGIYFINSDGTNLRQFLPDPAYWTDWSPDMRKLVIMDAYCSAMYTMNLDSSNKRVFGEGCTPRWSPDGTKIAYEDRVSGVCVIDTNGNNKRIVLDGGFKPDFFPDDKKIVCVKPLGESENIYTVNIDGSELTQLTNNYNPNITIRDPAVSPDGTKIAYCRSGGGSFREIRIINSDGRGDRFLVYAGYWWGGDPCWSPDGSKIIYSKETEKSAGLWIINVDGTGEYQLTLK